VSGESAPIPPIDAAQDHVRGPDGAPVLLVYGDYECPYTRAAYRSVEVLERRGLPFRFAFRQFPLVEIHPHALQAAVAALAADEQGRFWEMHEVLFANQKALGRDALNGYAAHLGLDVERFRRDFASDAQLRRLERDVAGGLAAGVHGTPTLFLDGVPHHGYGVDDLSAVLPDAPRA
jgi:protein-disulfide isomerase